METSLTNSRFSDTSYKYAKILSVFVIVFVFLSLLLGSKIVDEYFLKNLQIPSILNFIPKKTFFETIIAFLNIGFGVFVILDLKFFRPIVKLEDESPSSQSFNQLLFGWQMLWIGWILLYTCLGLNWSLLNGSQESSLGRIVIKILSNFFNLWNGFFFYYLFFVLDTYSVKTENDKDRDKGFKRNCVTIIVIGLAILVATTIFTNFPVDKNNEFFVENLIAAYTAVGMTFFFGRLDSHYLNLSRIVLAPLYLYAVIQLFWDSKIFDTQEDNPNRIVIFSVAFILKIVIFYLVSKEIREGVFDRYLKRAVREIEKKDKFERAIEEVKENETVFSITIHTNDSLEVVEKKINAINQIYKEYCKLFNISTSDRPIKVISIESGSLKIVFAILKEIANLLKDNIRLLTPEGRIERDLELYEKFVKQYKETIKSLGTPVTEQQEKQAKKLYEYYEILFDNLASRRITKPNEDEDSNDDEETVTNTETHLLKDSEEEPKKLKNNSDKKL
jgi:hypothetical protein